MKKLTRKLFLSVVTLALAVVSLSTTTFAWFSTNSSAGQLPVLVRTQTTAGSSLYISSDGISFGPSANPVVDTGNGVGETMLPMQVTYAADAEPTFQNLAGGDQTSGLLRYHFYLRNGGGTNDEIVEVKSLKIENITETMPTFYPATNLTTAGGDLTIGTGYQTDILNAMRCVYVSHTQMTYSSSGSYATQLSTPIAVGKKLTAQTNTYGVTANTYGESVVLNNLGLAYYNQMNGLTINPTPAYVTQDQSFTQLAVQDVVVPDMDAGAVVRVDFYFWVEGWDNECFEAILAQEISIAITFQFQSTRLAG